LEPATGVPSLKGSVKIIRIITLCIGLSIFIVGVATCRSIIFINQVKENTMQRKTIEEVLERYTKEWMSFRGVVGTAQGICDGRPCIKVYVTQRNPELETRIPDIIEGYQVVIEETGEIKALPEDQDGLQKR